MKTKEMENYIGLRITIIPLTQSLYCVLLSICIIY